MKAYGIHVEINGEVVAHKGESYSSMVAAARGAVLAAKFSGRVGKVGDTVVIKVQRLG